MKKKIALLLVMLVALIGITRGLESELVHADGGDIGGITTPIPTP